MIEQDAVYDDGPWRGPTTEAWLRRVSPWPTPWVGVSTREGTMSETTKQDWRDKLAAHQQPMEGPRPWEADGLSDDERYQLASELTAKAMLIVADEDPTLLDIPDSVTSSYDRASYDAAWQAAKKRWPGLDDWLGGITGNMFGWANQLVRWIHEKPPVGNPAIVTIRLPDDSDRGADAEIPMSY